MAWTYIWYLIFAISYLNETTNPLDTQKIWHCTLTLWSPLFLVFLAHKQDKSLFKKWSDLVLYWIWSSFDFFFLYSCIAGHMKPLGHQKLDKMTFHQFELSICTSYVFTASMDPSSAAKQSNLNPPKRKNI